MLWFAWNLPLQLSKPISWLTLGSCLGALSQKIKRKQMARNLSRNNTGASYTSGGMTLADGEETALQVDASGNLKVSAGGTGATADQVQGNAASAATDSGNPVKVGGKYNSSPPTLTNGQRGDVQLDASGNIKVTLLDSTGTSALGTSANPIRVQGGGAGFAATINSGFISPSASATGGYSFSAISTATTTVVKSAAGYLHTITIAGGTAGAITIYDNTAGSGTTIIPAFTPASVSVPVTLVLDIAFATGLTIVTAAATVITVSYK
jgi:hypothetical protein